MGSYRHNLSVLSGGNGEIIVSRRSANTAISKHSDYLPCTHCLGFFKKKELWRHSKQCHHRVITQQSEQTKMVHVTAQSRMLLEGGLASGPMSEAVNQLQDQVLSHMRYDTVYLAIQHDTIMVLFGNVMLRKLGPRRKHDISQRLRQLARLKLEMTQEPTSQLTVYLTGKNFDVVVAAVEEVCGLHEDESGIRSFEIPSLALRLGHHLLKCAELKRGQALRSQDNQMKEDVNNFISLHQGEWTDRISSIALATLRTAKFDKPQILPVTSDLIVLKDFLVTQLERRQQTLTNDQSYTNWRRLEEITLSRIILFNKRRGNEAAKLLISTYKSRPQWASSANEEIVQSLQPMEKTLLKRLDMVQTIGKQNKTVPIIMTPDVKSAIELLLEHRGVAGIPEDNKFIFATPGQGHLNSWQILVAVAKEAGCRQPNLVTSSRLRKYIATACQVLDLETGELEWLSRHLGHTLNTHRDFYRQHEGAVELTKVSRLLIAAESGIISKFQGKKLSEITLEELERCDQDQESENEESGDEEEMDEEIADLQSAKEPSTTTRRKAGRPKKLKKCSLNDDMEPEKNTENNACSSNEVVSPPRKRKRGEMQKNGKADADYVIDDDADDDTDDNGDDNEDIPATSSRKHGIRIPWTRDECALLTKECGDSIKKNMFPTSIKLKRVQKNLGRRTISQIRSKLQHLMKKMH